MNCFEHQTEYLSDLSGIRVSLPAGQGFQPGDGCHGLRWRIAGHPSYHTSGLAPGGGGGYADSPMFELIAED